MGFPRQEYGSGLPFPSPGDFPGAGIDLGSPVLLAGSLLPEPLGISLLLASLLLIPYIYVSLFGITFIFLDEPLLNHSVKLFCLCMEEGLNVFKFF